MKEVLKDSLTHGMSVVFCGTAVGTRSALRCACYAGIGNAFWKTVHEIGLTPRRLEPEEYSGAVTLGIGFTDLAKGISGNDVVLRQAHFDRSALRRKILEYQRRAHATREFPPPRPHPASRLASLRTMHFDVIGYQIPSYRSPGALALVDSVTVCADCTGHICRGCYA